MKRRLMKFILVICSFRNVTPLIYFADTLHEQHHQHGTHVQGVATLNWVMVWKTLQMSHCNHR